MDQTPADSYLLGLIGDHITGSLTPPLHEQMGRAAGLRVIYRPIDLAAMRLSAADLAEVLRWTQRLGFTGVNVTAPCKQDALRLVDQASEPARALGAVNTIRFDREPDGAVTGDNTDWSGFVRAFDRLLPEAPIGRVVLVGAGGAGSAVAYGMLRRAVAELIVFDEVAARGSSLVAAMNRRFPGRVVAGVDLRASVARADGVINATTTGMTGHRPGSSVPVETLRPDLWVADCVYLPDETALVQAAESLGCPTMRGTGMAVEQAMESFEIFTGVRPDPEATYAAFDRLVAERWPCATARGARTDS